MTYFPGLTGPLPDELVRVRHDEDEYFLDVLALTSNYRCIYGQGCRGTTPLRGEGAGQHRPADLSVTGCCRTGPGFGARTDQLGDGDPAVVDSPLRVLPFVEALTPEEAQHHDLIATGRWYEQEDGADARMALVEGNCIFLNTEMANGRTGCALFHHAERIGVEPQHTRPRVCHSTPAAAFTMADDTETLSGGFRLLVTLRPPWIGWFHPDGWFCTSDPAAYTGADPVFRSMTVEFAFLLGDDVWAALLPTLEQAWAERGERLRRGWGTPVALETPVSRH